MTIDTETLRSASKRNDVYKSAMQGLLAWAADTIDAHAAEIVRLREIVEMAAAGNTEYDLLQAMAQAALAQEGS